MNTIINDQHIMDLAKRSAAAFCRNYRPWGMDVEDVQARIWDCYAAAEQQIVCHPEGTPEREAAARTAIAYALNACRDASKANRSRLQPFQVRKAIERGENADRAMNRLGNDMEAWYRRGNSAAAKHRYLKIAFRHMQPRDVAICRAYLELLSWAEVAEKFGYSEGSFRRNVLPGLARRAQAVWKKVW